MRCLMSTYESKKAENSTSFGNSLKPANKKGASRTTSIQGMYSETTTSSPTDQFKYEKTIGSGSFATVWLASDKTKGQKVAIKIYEKIKLLDPEKLSNVRKEIEVLRRFSHPSIIKIYQEFETFRQIHIVMEFIGTTSLAEFLKKRQGKKLTEQEARHIFKQVASGIEYVHRKGISHRDIKLDNILIDPNSWTIKIIDFGFALEENGEANSRKSQSVFCGTPAYMAPEIVGRMGYKAQEADVWALGVVLYQLIRGELPFKGNTDRELFGKITNGKFEEDCEWSEELREIVKGILKKNPMERMDMEEVMRSDWLEE